MGVKHPPIPADNEAWERDEGGFVGNHFFYGERSWIDVRMRVVGHLATVARDRGRWYASRGDFRRAAKIQTRAAERIRAESTPDAGIASEMRALWLAAAERDAELLQGMAAGSLPPAVLDHPGRVYPSRVAMLQLALRGQKATQAERERWTSAVASMKAQPLPTDLGLTDFGDFDERHRLRVRLLAAYLDSVDPVGFSEPWGYWDVDALQRTIDGVAKAGDILAGPDWWKAGLRGKPPLWASVIAHQAHPPTFTLDEVGGMPTGDSFIDVAGEPGPRAIGRLARLGMDDAIHVAWLMELVAELNELIEQDPLKVVTLIEDMAVQLNRHPHGSRYYNVKQVRNAGVRQLARAGRPDLAVQVLRTNRPLHHQDWACPNRAGILLGIEGRLLAMMGAPEAAGVLQQAAEAAQTFLGEIDRVAG